MQEEKGLNKAKLTAKDIRRIEQSEMETEEIPEKSTQGASGVQLSKDLGVELKRVDAKHRKIKPDFLGPVAVNEKELIECISLRTVYLALRHAREEKATDEVEALTEQLDNVRLNLYNAISPVCTMSQI